jgi:hypothetical protein
MTSPFFPGITNLCSGERENRAESGDVAGLEPPRVLKQQIRPCGGFNQGIDAS